MRYPLQIEMANTKEIMELIEEVCQSYVNEARKCAYVSADNEIQKMLTDKSFDQFLAVSYAITNPIKEIDDEFLDIFGLNTPIDELSRLMQYWITLGSACESALQIFLAIYISDFKNSGWRQWKNFNYEEVKNSFFKILDSAVTDGHIEKINAKALKEGIKKQLKTKQNLPSLYELTLNELISFFAKEVGWESGKIDKLHFIRKNRNCVHSFKERDLGTWGELFDCLKFFCSMILDLTAMTPDVDEYLAYEAEARAEWEAEMRAEMKAEWEHDY